MGGAFGGTGQKCTASSRLVVHEAVHDTFVDKLVAATRRLKVGHALDPETQMGPVVSESQLGQNLENLALAQREGGELLTGGGTIGAADGGLLYGAGGDRRHAQRLAGEP